MTTALFAQFEPLSVLNLLVQGGSFAVLVFLVVWVLPQLGAKLFAAHEAEMARFTTALERIQQSFRDEVELVRQRADVRSQQMVDRFVDSTKQARDQLTQGMQGIAVQMKSNMDSAAVQLSEYTDALNHNTEILRTLENYLRTLNRPMLPPPPPLGEPRL
jgi:methionine-rich copper-binding protein CopC